jgi:hypothetical protein
MRGIKHLGEKKKPWKSFQGFASMTKKDRQTPGGYGALVIAIVVWRRMFISRV